MAVNQDAARIGGSCSIPGPWSRVLDSKVSIVRKLLILPIAFIVMAGLMSPAEAASKRYSLTVKDRAYEYVSKGKYRSHSVIDVSKGHERDYVKISGRVKRGPVKGKYVRIYATNTNDPKYPNNRYFGKAKLSSKGKFSKRVRPTNGGRWKFRVVVKSAGGYKGTSRTASIDAFHWTDVDELVSLNNLPGITVQRGESREFTGPNYKRYPGTRWTNQFAMTGGSQVTFPTKAYRCKKISFKVGVSDSTPDESPSGIFRLVQNGAVKASLTMTRNDPYFNATDSNARSTKVRNSVSASRDITFRVLASGAAPEEQVKFIVGNPKAFCTFPAKY